MYFKSCLRAILAAALITPPAVSTAFADGQANTRNTPHAIKLRTAEIDTSGPNLSVFSEGQPSPGGHFYILQFRGPVRESWKNRVSAMGVQFHGYLPEDAFIVKMDADAASEVSADPAVKWVGPYRHKYKLAPKGRAPEAAQAATETGQTEYTVKVFDKEDLAPIISRLEAQGATVRVVADNDGLNGKILRVRMDDSLAQDAAKIDEVEWVEQYIPPRPLNDVAEGIILDGAPGTVGGSLTYPLSLTGTGQVVGIMDTGLDSGTIPTTNPAFQGNAGNGQPKIKDAFGYTDKLGSNGSLGYSGTWSDSDGHGTHTAGSLTGKPFGTYDIHGVAYDAQLVVQALYEDSAKNLYVPDLNSQGFPDAYNDGVRVHSDSWGGGNPGEYDSWCVDADTFIWNHKDFVACFAAGNGGVDANKDGVVDPGSVTSPSTAKDVIAVGATESYRPIFKDTWGQDWPSSFPVNPIYSDPIANNADGMAAWSSRGPTADGRVKPDLVAPGTYILSTKSSLAPASNYWDPASQNGLYNSSYNQYFAFDAGTSMATPFVAGAAALVRQYYTQIQGLADPSAALIKATLISGAFNMAPGQYGAAGTKTQEIYNPPDNSQGWGRVDVADSISPPAPENVLFVDYTSGLSTTGQTETYFYTVGDTSAPVKVTLVWSDYPTTLPAAKDLVNDLDLSVTGPDGTVYHGNQFDNTSGFSIPNASAFDRTNNVEVVNINPSYLSQNGTIEVQVNGHNIPDGPQPFALVIEGGGISQTTCDFSLSPSSADFTANGGDSSFDVTSNGGCTWTAASGNPWITVSTPGGQGDGTVGYSVAQNDTAEARTGHIYVDGNIFTVTQDAAQASLSMSMTQAGKAVTLNAAFLLGNLPIANKPVTFYDHGVKKGVRYTNVAGTAMIKFTAALGPHSAYATTSKVTTSTGPIQPQSTQGSPLVYTIERVQPYSPANGKPVQTSPVVLSWGSMTGATGYQVQVYTSSAIPNALADYSVTTNTFTSYSSYTLRPGTARFWRVRAVLPTGFSLYSAPWRFKYKPVPVLQLSAVQSSPSKVTATATVTDGSGNPISGRTIYFYDDGASKGYKVTLFNGTATKTFAVTSGSTVEIQFKGDSKYSPAAPANMTMP